MAWDSIPKLNSYSLTDLNDFSSCNFRFFVKHHLDKKYEIEEGSPQMALGVLLDQSIKIFHDTGSHGKPIEFIPLLVKDAEQEIRKQVASKPKPSFNSSVEPFLTPELVDQAIKTFQEYYEGIEGKIKPTLGPVEFCKRIIKTNDGVLYKIWGGPDTFEMGDDGVPEIVDYKSRTDIEKGKANMDMDLMPKIYTLLCIDKMRQLGFKKVRFVVRFWQDPKENSFYEEFELDNLEKYDELFKQMIEKILNVKEYGFCNRKFCSACSSPKKEEYIVELTTSFNLAPLVSEPKIGFNNEEESSDLEDN